MSSDDEEYEVENFQCAHIITVTWSCFFVFCFFLYIIFNEKRRITEKQFMVLVFVNKRYPVKMRIIFYLLLVL